MKKLLFGAAALVLSCSLASAGEGKFKVDVGLDVGVVENVLVTIDEISEDVAEYGGISIIPRVSGTYQFDENWSASLNFRAVIGFDDDDAEVLEEDAEGSFQQIEIGGLAGYTLKVNEQFSVTPVAGLSWRTLTLEADVDDYNVDVEIDASFLSLDFGANMAFKVNDKVSIVGGLKLGLAVAGSAEAKVSGEGDTDGDLDGVGLLFGVDAGVEYKLNDSVALVGGLSYELARTDWEWDEADADGEIDTDRFAIKLGAVFSF